MNARGFTLIECLVASAVFLAVAGAASMLVAPVHLVFERVLSSSDMDARARTGIGMLLAELADAGSGATVGPPLIALNDLLPVVSPGGDAVTITRVPAGAPQGTLRGAVAAGDAAAALEIGGACYMQDSTCGFRPGAAAVIFDAARAERVSIADVDSGTSTLRLASSVAGPFDAGAAVVAVERVSYRLRAAGDSARLVRISPGGAEQPVVDHVVAFDVAAWSADPYAHGTDVTLRVHTASPALRGDPHAPDLELHASVLLRER